MDHALQCRPWYGCTFHDEKLDGELPEARSHIRAFIMAGKRMGPFCYRQPPPHVCRSQYLCMM